VEIRGPAIGDNRVSFRRPKKKSPPALFSGHSETNRLIYDLIARALPLCDYIWIALLSREHAVSSADAASRQRQILRELAADYGRQLCQVLQVRQLLKGSVYQLRTRCGHPSCHCTKPHGQRHSATVLSWSEAGRTRIRSIPASERARVRQWAEQYRRLRQARVAMGRLHQQILRAVDRLEQALRLPPPAPARRRPRR
jgi:hypothetical protein